MPLTYITKVFWSSLIRLGSEVHGSGIQILVRFVLLVSFVSLVELVGLRSNQLNELSGCIHCRFPDT